MRIACWITKATNTHSEYAILIAFPLQQWLHERPQYYVIRALPVKVKVKVKRALEEATKAQRGSRGIALLFL
jgi:hypothetical protein